MHVMVIMVRARRADRISAAAPRARGSAARARSRGAAPHVRGHEYRSTIPGRCARRRPAAPHPIFFGPPRRAGPAVGTIYFFKKIL